MGIRSRVRVEYWRSGTKVPGSERLLYAEETGTISRADIDASDLDVVVHDRESAWDFVNVAANAGCAHLMSTGTTPERLAGRMAGLKTQLSERTMVRSANLNLSYPHPLYDTVRIVFESQSAASLDSPGIVDDARHLSWPCGQSETGILFEAECNGFRRNAAYTINLDEMYAHMLSKLEPSKLAPFYSSPDRLRPFVFAFALKESTGNPSPLSVLHVLSLNLFRARQAVPRAGVEIVYWNHGVGFGHVVAQQRITDYSPKIWPFKPAIGTESQEAEIPLTPQDGEHLVEGKPYNLVSVHFNVVSRLKHDNRTWTVLTGKHVPRSGDELQLPVHVVQPLPSPAADEFGQPYLAEGTGTATVIFSPRTMPEATVHFRATQDPGAWSTLHSIRMVRAAPAYQVQCHASGRE